MLQLKTVTPQFADFDKVSALYHSAFPKNERRPLEEMFTFLSGGGEFLALYDGETFCGFVCLLSWQDITHILYLAIDSRLRGRGYGTGMLSAIRQRYPHSRLIADIELEPPAPQQRRAPAAQALLPEKRLPLLRGPIPLAGGKLRDHRQRRGL